MKNLDGSIYFDKSGAEEEPSWEFKIDFPRFQFYQIYKVKKYCQSKNTTFDAIEVNIHKNGLS